MAAKCAFSSSPQLMDRDRQTEDSPTVNALRYATRTYLSHARARLVPVGEAETSPRGVNSNLGEDEAALAALCSIWDWVCYLSR